MLTQQKSDPSNTPILKSPGIEEWRPIPNENSYEASSAGRIRNIKTGRILKQWPMQCNSKAYIRCSLGRNRKGWVHRLVCAAFHGPPPSGQNYACHVPNSDPADNRACNLAWGTRNWNESHKDGQAMCECKDKAADHVDCNGYCTAIKPDGKHCECMEFRVKKEEPKPW
jgi:hypothetical protein